MALYSATYACLALGGGGGGAERCTGARTAGRARAVVVMRVAGAGWAGTS